MGKTWDKDKYTEYGNSLEKNVQFWSRRMLKKKVAKAEDFVFDLERHGQVLIKCNWLLIECRMLGQMFEPELDCTDWESCFPVRQELSPYC